MKIMREIVHIVCIYIKRQMLYDKRLRYKEEEEEYYVYIPMGIAYISSSLKNAGYETEIFFYGMRQENVCNRIRKTDKLVLLSIITELDYMLAKKIIRSIKKKNPKIKVGVGGSYPTLVPQDIMANKYVDMVCIGEGEIATLEYVKQVEKGQYHKTDNLWIRDDKGEIIRCDRSVVIEDIDSLPYPDRDGWLKNYDNINLSSLGLKKSDFIRCVLLERGCNNRCVYCSHNALSKKQEGKYLRYRNIDKVIEEIEYLCIHYSDIKAVSLYADNALSNIKYFMELCQKLIKFNEKRKNKIEFSISLNISREVIKYKEEIISLIKKANIVYFDTGLQSVSLDIRKKLRRPYYSNEEFEDFCYMMKLAGIKIPIDILWHPCLFNKQIYKETFMFLRKIKPYKTMFFWLVPFKGTELYKNKEKIVSYNNAKLIDKLRYNTLKYKYAYEVYGIKKMFKEIINEISSINKLKNKIAYIKRNIFVRLLQKKIQVKGVIKELSEYKLAKLIIMNIIKRINEVRNNIFVKLNNELEKKIQRYQERAKIEIDKGNFKQAIKYFNKVKIKVDNYWVYGDRAIAKMNIGDYKGAIKDFDKILKLDPKEIYKEKREECLKKLKFNK
jgi:radical SAM superfamily enzyme YgiQ (UPF0313 family)